MSTKTSRNVPKEVTSLVKEVGFSKLLDYYQSLDFIEVTGKIGGDTLTFRKYSNGLLVER